MIGKNKKYFTFFGILAATVDKQILSQYSSIHAYIEKNIPKITKSLVQIILVPVNQYSTNKK